MLETWDRFESRCIPGMGEFERARTAIARWPFRGALKPEPIDAEFKEVAATPAKKAGKSVRLIKGEG